MLPMPRLSIQHDLDLDDFAVLDNETGEYVAAARSYADADILLQTLSPYYPSPSVLPILDPADFGADLMSGAVDAADKLARLDTAAFQELTNEMVALSGDGTQTQEATSLWLRRFMAQYAMNEQGA